MTPPSFLVLRLSLALAAAVTLSACGGSDGPTTPPVSPAQIATEAATNNQAAAPGAPLPLPIRVRVTAASGAAVAGVTITWQVSSGGGSVSPGSSTTNSVGIAETQWTLGPAVGTQSVTATIGGLNATVVAFASSGEVCGIPLSLAVGEVCLVTPAQAANLAVQGGASGGEFVVIPHYDGNFARNAIGISAAASGVVPVIGPPMPATGPSFSTTTLGPSTLELQPSIAFKRRLRRMVETDLVPRVREGSMGHGTAPASTSFSVAPAAPRLAVGEVLTLNVNDRATCTSPDNRQAIVRHESPNAVFVEDLSNPAGGFTAQDYADIAASFEQHIWPVDTGAFGAPTDIDDNKRVLILYTAAVNAMTPAGSTAFVGGFFFSRDLFRKTEVITPAGKTLQPCAASNEREMFYMLVPDPGAVHGLRWEAEQVKTITVGTIAHELQHLINAGRRLWVNQGATYPETVWMEEGLSHVAEELVYYRASNFTPRMNLDSTNTHSAAVFNTFQQYSRSNIARFRAYLRATAANSPYGESSNDDDLETRGAIWSFLRWAADRQPTDGTIWRQLVNGNAIGADNLRAVFGQNIGMRFSEWAAAHYLDDTHPDVPVALRHPSWHFRSVVPRISEPPPRPGYPLNTIALGTAGSASVTLVDGGAAYFRFGVAPGVTATLNLTSGGGQLPSGVRVWVARTK